MTIYKRVWQMPNLNTFNGHIHQWIEIQIRSQQTFLKKHYGLEIPREDMVILEPFARNSKIANHTNDINPDTDAQDHMPADEWLQWKFDEGVRADIILYDPPYSPRQITECYSAAGIKATQQDTQSSFYTKFKKLIPPLVKKGGLVLSFGWNSSGMGKYFGHYEEILLVGHGGAHNDTICVSQRKNM